MMHWCMSTMLILSGLSMLPMASLQSDPHGHVIFRDREGNCSVDNEDCGNDDNSCICDSEESCCCQPRRYKQKKIKPGFEEEDLPHQVDQDASWPSRRENFSEMFR